MRVTSSFFAAAALLLLCSSSAIAAPAKACDVGTQQMASSIFGAAVSPGADDVRIPGASECRFPAPGNNASVFIGWMDASMLGPNPAVMFKTVTVSEPGTNWVAVPGLGEAAYYTVTTAETSVSILYHGKIVKIGAVASKNPGIKNAVIAVAKQILAKL